MDTLVQASSLGRRFGQRWAIARLDLHIQNDERLLIIGPNGCGKTTLLRIMSTLLPPHQGNITWFGGNPRPRQKIGMMGHDPGIYEDLSAADNLYVFARIMDVEPTEVPVLLSTVGLDERPDPVSRYSAGMRRRLALALLLQKQPQLALLDEPFAQMDPGGIAQVSSAIRALPGAVVIASHQVHHAAPLCTRAILMDEGQIRWSGSAQDASKAWHALHEERGEL